MEKSVSMALQVVATTTTSSLKLLRGSSLNSRLLEWAWPSVWFETCLGRLKVWFRVFRPGSPLPPDSEEKRLLLVWFRESSFEQSSDWFEAGSRASISSRTEKAVWGSLSKISGMAAMKDWRADEALGVLLALNEGER